MKLIAGLGNPGLLVVDEPSRRKGVTSRKLGLVARFADVRLLEPETFELEMARQPSEFVLL